MCQNDREAEKQKCFYSILIAFLPHIISLAGFSSLKYGTQTLSCYLVHNTHSLGHAHTHATFFLHCGMVKVAFKIVFDYLKLENRSLRLLFISLLYDGKMQKVFKFAYFHAFVKLLMRKQINTKNFLFGGKK